MREAIWLSEKNAFKASKSRYSGMGVSEFVSVVSFAGSLPLFPEASFFWLFQKLGRTSPASSRNSIRKMERITFVLFIMAPLFFVEDPVGICRSMDFRHHIKFTVNIVLCVTVIGIIDQYLAVCRNTSEYDEVSAAGEKSCPLRGDDRTAFGECLK